MDAKLDRILELISTEKKVEIPFCHGIGQNISGSGMQMVVDTPVECGKIIHTTFLLSQFPFVFMNLFGEVIREKEFNKDGTTLYRIGIKFLDLNINDREKIIAFVFQKQREAIRNSKSVAKN
jgi:c-di-GMP-binding flagellar brake protein YcgR